MLAEAAAATILDRVTLDEGVLTLGDDQLDSLTMETLFAAITDSRVMSDLGEIDDSDFGFLDRLLLSHPPRHDT